MNVSVSGTIDQKMYLKKFRGASAPLAPPMDPPMPWLQRHFERPQLFHVNTTMVVQQGFGVLRWWR